jgi:hypothetical protein
LWHEIATAVFTPRIWQRVGYSGVDMMMLHMAVRSGRRIRHRDWPPFHYAQMQPTEDGKWRLCRFTPQSGGPPVELQLETLSDHANWKILDMEQD